MNIQAIDTQNRFRPYSFDAGHIGDWHGEEERAAQKLNRILEMFDNTLPDYANDQVISELSEKVRQDWGKNFSVLNKADLELKLYVINTSKAWVYKYMPDEAA